MSRAAEREIESLERDLEGDDISSEEREAIHRSIREIEREVGAEEQWREEGVERGYRQ